MSKIYTLNFKDTIQNALCKLEQNHIGLVVAVNEHNQVMGVATDGDIRRRLLSGMTLNDSFESCINSNCILLKKGVSREEILKKLDNKIKAIPIIDDEGYFVDLIHRDNLPNPSQRKTLIRSVAPVRISFAGGGSDITPYFIQNNGVVLSATIQKYCNVTLRIRSDNKIIIHSYDFKDSIYLNALCQDVEDKKSFDLILSVLRAINPNFGFELTISCDFSVGSGLGGSAAVCAAIIAAFNHVRSVKWDQYEIAELAFQSERITLGVSGGWQDQYATVFGGINFIEFRKERNSILPLRLPDNTLLELESNLILCNTKVTHESGGLHLMQREQLGKSEVCGHVADNVKLTYKMRDHMLRGELDNFGLLLDQAWNLKRKFSPMISSESLDEIYETAKAAGAQGGKLLGAGAGGFFLFYVSPTFRHAVVDSLQSLGMTVSPVKFEPKGVQSWDSFIDG